MATQTTQELKTLLATNVRSGTQENPAKSSALELRELVTNMLDSGINVKDGGMVFENPVGYSNTISIVSDNTMPHKKYVDDAILPLTLRVYEDTFTPTFTPDNSLYNCFSFTNVSGTISIMPPTNVGSDFHLIIFRFYSASSQTITWDGTAYFAANVSLPTATLSGQYLEVYLRKNATENKYGCVGINSGSGGGGSGTVNSGLRYQLAYYAANGTAVSGLTSAANGVLVTDGSGVPSIGSTLPSGLTIPGYQTSLGFTPISNSLSSGRILVGNAGNIATDVVMSGDITISNSGVTAIGAGKVTNTMLAGSIDLTSKVTGVLPATNGGTGVNNGSNIITLAGNLTTSGAFNTTFAQQFSGIVTLPPAVSTLATLALSETFTNKTISSGSTYNAGAVTSSGTITGVNLVISGGSSPGGSVSSNAAALIVNSTNDSTHINLSTGSLVNRGYIGADSVNCFHVWNSGAGAMMFSINSSTGNMNVRSGKSYFGGTTTPSETMQTNGNLYFDTIGKGLIFREGVNARMGIATLSAGTVTVNNTSVTANTRILLSHTSKNGGAMGNLEYSISAGTSFTITSDNAGDTGIVLWLLIEKT